jgi:hypothetical protein
MSGQRLLRLGSHHVFLGHLYDDWGDVRKFIEFSERTSLRDSRTLIESTAESPASDQRPVSFANRGDR